MAHPDSFSKGPSLPTEQDFDPYGGGLDAQCAWKNFGGLTLDEANNRFRENPDYYQEDFMFMGGRAFAFYFPVIESFLQETSPSDDGDDRQAWILALGIKIQFDGKNLPLVVHLVPRVLDLSEFVRANIHLFESDPEDQHRVDTAWQELQAHIQKVTNQLANDALR